jgi:hypothetical protein
MVQVLNFDTVTVGTVDVTKGGQTYKLRDDVATEVLLRRFKIIEMLKTVGDTPTYEQMVDVIARQEAEVLDICTAIFHHTYPDMTQADVATLLTARERQQVCAAFFSLPFSSSDEPPSATERQPATPQTAPTVDPAPTAAAESSPMIASLPSSLPSSAV